MFIFFNIVKSTYYVLVNKKYFSMIKSTCISCFYFVLGTGDTEMTKQSPSSHNAYILVGEPLKRAEQECNMLPSDQGHREKESMVR